MGDRGKFSKVCLGDSSWCWLSALLILVQERGVGIGATVTKGNLHPAFTQIRGEQTTFATSVDFQLPSAQNNSYTKVAYLLWHIPGPFTRPPVFKLAPSFLSCVTLSKSLKLSIKQG